MKDLLIVDGYNIIYAWPTFETYRDTFTGKRREGRVRLKKRLFRLVRENLEDI